MSTRPNILWYCTDQQRFDTIGGLGNPDIHTPNLVRFLTRSTAFTRAYCQSPICTPSRASFLTGEYPSAMAINQNGNPYFPAHHAERLVPHRLAKAGFDCGLVGKLHIASAARGQEPRVDDGYVYFQYSHDHKGPDARGHDYAQWLRDQGVDTTSLMDSPVTGKTYRDRETRASLFGLKEPTAEKDNFPASLHQTHWCTEKAIEFIDRDRPVDQPWMLSINPFDPHPPFDPPWEYYRRYNPAGMPGPHAIESDLDHQQSIAEAGVDFQSQSRRIDADKGQRIRAAYYAMIEQIDTEFGRILDHLDHTGHWDNTIIIFTSDHGEALGDHGLLLKGCRFYEGSVRVPLIISYPGISRDGAVSSALVELTDLAPTIYHAAGLPIPYWVQGRSLVPVLSGETDHHRDSVRCEFLGAIAFPDQTHATMYRDERWKLVTYHGKNLTELFDLDNDPWEHHDLSRDSKYADVLADLQRRSFDAAVLAHPPDNPRTEPY